MIGTQQNVCFRLLANQYYLGSSAETSSSSTVSCVSEWPLDWCWSWNFSALATWCKELTHWKRPWCWERWRAGGEGDDRGWDGWMASPTHWRWVWVDSGSWWWTGRPGVLQSMGSQRVGHDWATEPNWARTRVYDYVWILAWTLPSCMTWSKDIQLLHASVSLSI